jgi:hypothetical protein
MADGSGFSMTEMREKLARMSNQLRNSREQLKKGGQIALHTGEVFAGGAGTGLFRGRFPEYADFGPSKMVPVELAVATAAHAYAASEDDTAEGKERAEHARRFGDGALAGYGHFRAMAWGQELASKAKK